MTAYQRALVVLGHWDLKKDGTPPANPLLAIDIQVWSKHVLQKRLPRKAQKAVRDFLLGPDHEA